MAAKSNVGPTDETLDNCSIEIKKTEPETLASPEQVETTQNLEKHH